MRSRWQALRADQSGGIAVASAIALVALLGMAAIVLDLGHIYVVKREMQKAAEAGAYAGARALALPATSTVLNWANGASTATATVRENSVEGALLSTFNDGGGLQNVQAGYWDTTWTKSSAPANLNGYLDPAAYTPGATEIPAVKVSIARTASSESGPVTTFVASVLGFGAMDVAATATAILPSPTSVPSGDCFPMATPQYWVRQNYDAEPPASFRIGSSYHTPDGGQWTSFFLDVNNVPTIRNLIDGGNPVPVKIGDEIWIEPGTKDTLYSYATEKIGQTVMIPVVPDNFDTHALAPVLGFVAFFIEDAVGGSGKYIQGHFVKNYLLDDGSGAGGPSYGTFLPPKLIQ